MEQLGIPEKNVLKLKISGRVLIRSVLKEDMHFNFLPFILAATVN